MAIRIKKKVLLLSSGDTFGAYEYLYRMAKAMEEDYEVALVVRDKRKKDIWIYHVEVLTSKNSLLKRIFNYCKRKMGFKTDILQPDPLYVFLPNEDESIQLVIADTVLKAIPFVPDIIFSGMTPGFINTSTLLDLHIKTGAKVYQVMVDMNLLTGGCHSVWGCEGFKSDCSNCPAIANTKFNGFTVNNLAIKKKNIQQGDFKLLVIPGWNLHQTNLSTLYKNRLIVQSCNIVDTSIFTDINRHVAKQLFGISPETKVVFAGSNNQKAEVKGRRYFVDALSKLWTNLNDKERENIVVLMIGHKHQNEEDEHTLKIQFKKVLIDFITDYRLLSLAYQASEVFVCPSLEEGGPMMIPEAMACGTPVVGFEMGSLFDNSLVENGVHGYRVRMKDTTEMAYSLKNILELSKSEFNLMSLNARKQALSLSSEQAFVDSISDILQN